MKISTKQSCLDLNELLTLMDDVDILPNPRDIVIGIFESIEIELNRTHQTEEEEIDAASDDFKEIKKITGLKSSSPEGMRSFAIAPTRQKES
jgi:hypothetical protein